MQRGKSERCQIQPKVTQDIAWSTEGGAQETMGALNDLGTMPFDDLWSQFALERPSAVFPCVSVWPQSCVPVETTPESGNETTHG